MQHIPDKVQAYIEQLQLLSKGQHVLVALSGGADSICLLHVLRSLCYDVECAHCNFRLRGQESDRDEAFVRQVCDREGITLHVSCFETETYARTHHISIETAARQLRYEWFEQLLTERKLDVVCTGHHSDDNVETLLLNLVRGTGLRGLCGIPPRQGHVVRPLLCLSRREIVGFLKEKALDCVTDSTNLQDDFARNKVRLDILPMLRSINPAADANILTCIDNLNEAHRMYRYCVDEFCAAAVDSPSELDIATILRAPSPLSVLHELLSPLGFNRSQVTDILRSISSTGRIFTSSTHRLVINRDQLVIEQQTSSVEHSIVTSRMKNSEALMRDIRQTADCNVAYFDADQIENHHLTIRSWHQGDRFQPFGMKGTRLVSDLLTDLKLNRFEREKQQVLLADDEIIWVIGRRASELYKVKADTINVLRCETTQSS